jgi:hypothetical protein
MNTQLSLARRRMDMPTNLTATSQRTGSLASNVGHLILAAYLVLVVVVCGLLVVNGPQIRADAEAREAHIVEEENRAFCSSFGMGPETARYAQCAGGLMQIRARHLDRYVSNTIL